MDSGREAALTEAKELYKKAHKKVKSCASVKKKKNINSLAAEAQDKSNPGAGMKEWNMGWSSNFHRKEMPQAVTTEEVLPYCQ